MSPSQSVQWRKKANISWRTIKQPLWHIPIPLFHPGTSQGLNQDPKVQFWQEQLILKSCSCTGWETPLSKARRETHSNHEAEPALIQKGPGILSLSCCVFKLLKNKKIMPNLIYYSRILISVLICCLENLLSQNSSATGLGIHPINFGWTFEGVLYFFFLCP